MAEPRWPDDVLFAVVWAAFDRNDSRGPRGGGDKAIEAEAVALERGHRERARGIGKALARRCTSYIARSHRFQELATIPAASTEMVEPRGIEPLTFAMPLRRSPS